MENDRTMENDIMKQATRRTPRRLVRNSGLAVALVALLWSVMASAIPNEITAQGFLTNNEGLPANGNFALSLTLYDAQSGGGVLWTETQVGVPVTNGLFNLRLGANTVGNPLSLSIFRDNAALWLGIKVEAGPGVPAGGENELPLNALKSVGFAYVAMHSENAVFAVTALDLTCTACVSEAELDFALVTETELTAALSALPGQVTTVDGLAGGNITGDTTVTGSLSTTTAVGVGTSTPTTTCDADAMLCVAGDAYANTNLLTSDLRWKKNIRTLDNALDKLMALRGVTYEWRTNEFKDWNFSGGTHLGVIAQEVEKVLPELVVTNDQGFKTVNYNGLVVPLIEAVKTQQAQIGKLEQRLAAVEKLGSLQKDGVTGAYRWLMAISGFALCLVLLSLWRRNYSQYSRLKRLSL
jgi:hypothetical protein